MTRFFSERIIFTSMVVLTILLTYFASDIYLPALPGLRSYLGCTVAQLQITLSIYFFGMAVSQFIGGPVIDCVGYRRVALWMCVVFLLSSLVCSFANTLMLLIVARLLQAFSAGVLAIVGRASIPRVCSQEDTIKVYFIVAPLVCLSPAIAPVVGGYLTHFFGWRAVFWFLSLFALLVFGLFFRHFHLGKSEDEGLSIHPVAILKTYLGLVKNRRYLAFLIICCAAFASYFAYIAESPFIFHQMHYTAQEIGHYYILLALAFMVASIIARKLLHKISYRSNVYIGFVLSAVGILALFLVGQLDIKYAFEIYVPASIYSAGNGFITPMAISQASVIFPKRAGFATSLLSSSFLVSAAIAGAVVDHITHGSVAMVALFMGAITLMGFVSFIIL